MEKQELEALRRLQTGKGFARKLRVKGFIPAICYQKGLEPIPLSLEKKKLEKLLKTVTGQNILIQLKIKDDQGSEHQEAVILKDIQRNHFSEVFHADFLAVRMDEVIVVEVPIRLKGEPVEALRDGGLVQQLKRSLEVECLPANMPEFIEVDISSLVIGDSIHVEQVQIAEGVRILSDPSETLVVISMPEEEVEEEKPEEEEEGEGEVTEETEKTEEEGSGSKE